MQSSSKQNCAICNKMVNTGGHAIFTAECSHSFHFNCIASNVTHGNRVCPVCQAVWKDIPFQRMPSQQGHFDRSALPPYLARTPPRQTYFHRYVRPQFQAQEPSVFDDDEPVNQDSEEMNSSTNSNSDEGIEIKTYTELPAVAKSDKFDDFGIVINLKAPVTKSLHSRTPIDLVTMLDISGSMTGSKISLLKQAMGFVVQNLGPLDRLSVISFSSSARRVFPLRRMTEMGKQESLQMINSLVADGMTNIDEALKKGSKVMNDRKFKNPVSGMIFLSDGHETCNTGHPLTLSNTRIPIHTFGFGADHDANLLHSISEQSGGIFSFIEDENVIQDAFAQCIGGLLSVVVQELRVEVECIHPVLRLGSIKAGSYKVGMDSNGRWGFIEVGDLYAEEERDFLVSMDIPVNEADNEMPLVKFRVIHKDPIKNTFMTTEGNEVTILRPETMANQTVSLEVDRQRNRLNVASVIADAHVAAEHGNLSEARLMLEGCQRKLSFSAYYHEDEMYGGLDEELEEMRKGMANPARYGGGGGRAFMLSGLDAHSKQRATTRGDSTKRGSRKRTYQTPKMETMVKKSQKMVNPPPKPTNKRNHEDQSTSSTSKRRKP